MNIARFFIERPVFSIVLSILAVIAGLFTMVELPVAQYPDITPPTVKVSASYPGADPQLIATTIGAPIEEAVNGVEGMIYMSSSSTQGSYSLTVTFEVGTDIDLATIHVQNKLNTVTSTLPESVQQQGITVEKTSTDILMIFCLLSDHDEYDDLYLTNYATLNLVDPLTRVPGVGEVSLFGSSKYSIRVWMDPEVLRVRCVSASDIYEAIAAQNLESTAGAVGQAPLDRPVAFEYTLTTPGQLTSVEEFAEIIVRSTETGEYLRLGDIASIELGSQSYTTTSSYSGAPCALIAISQTPGANALDVANDVADEMQHLASYLPQGVRYVEALNTTDFIRDSMREVVVTFFETLLLVMLVILLFLQNWKAVLIPAVTIPVSLIATFAVMGLLGFSLNLLTLFGLILAIAIVVDDAIVVVENADRIMSERARKRGTAGTEQPQGNPVHQAVEEAVGELIGPIISIDLCMLAVFVPAAFIPGITGQLIQQFALTIAASTVISGFVSLTLTPTLCALLLQPKEMIEEQTEAHPKNLIYRWFDAGFGAVTRGYDFLMQRLLHRPWLAAGVFLLLAVPALWLFARYPTTFLPSEDQGYLMVMVQLPDGATKARTEEAMNDLAQNYIARLPGVESYVEVTGFSMMGGASNNSGMVWVVLKPWKERKSASEHATALVERINREAYLGVPQAMVYAVNPPAIQGLGVSGGLSLELQDRNNLGAQALYEAYVQLLDHREEAPSLSRINSFYSPNVPQYEINIDRSRLRLLGLTYEQVAHTLAYYLGTAYVNDYIAFGRVWQVNVGGKAAARAELEDIVALSIVNSQGEAVPLSTFVSFDYTTAPAALTRYNMYRSANIDLSVKSGGSSGNAIRETEALIEAQLGNSFGYQWTGTALQELESGASLVIIYLLAFVLVYLVLAAQYESWAASIAVILGVPMAVLGVVVGCTVWGLPVSVYTQIGLILLIALCAKNAILIVAFARDARKKGSPILRAALDGGNIRLRPVMMTSLAFVLGVMPLMFASGAGAAGRISLGVAVVFGMAACGLLGTLFVPNFFAWMQQWEEWAKRITFRRSYRQNDRRKS
jgi:hydrophobe/amphiphile efflux-1 (HAE1) family protein